MNKTSKLLLLSFLLCFTLSGLSAVHDVQIIGSTFSPANIQIEAGDTVRWTNSGGFHNVEANDGSFKCSDSCEVVSGDGNGGASSTWTTIEITFNYVGLFNYLCEIHFAGGMIGSVDVVAPTSVTVHEVHLTNTLFTPDDLTIAAGDIVNFINDAGFHNVTADDNSFECGEGCLGAGTNVSSAPSSANWNVFVAFENTGDVPYYCGQHGNPGGVGMSGIIRVADPDVIFANGFE